jgi:hypothetical protein
VLIATVTEAGRTVVFCGDLVEESGDPCIGADSDPVARADGPRSDCDELRPVTVTQVIA